MIAAPPSDYVPARQRRAVEKRQRELAGAGLITLLDAAAALGIHSQSLRRLIKRGRAPGWYMHAGLHSYVCPRVTFDAFAATYDVRPGAKDWAAGGVMR